MLCEFSLRRICSIEMLRSFRGSCSKPVQRTGCSLNVMPERYFSNTTWSMFAPFSPMLRFLFTSGAMQSRPGNWRQLLTTQNEMPLTASRVEE